MHPHLDGKHAVHLGEGALHRRPHLLGNRGLCRLHGEEKAHRTALEIELTHGSGLDQARRGARRGDRMKFLEDLLLGGCHL